MLAKKTKQASIVLIIIFCFIFSGCGEKIVTNNLDYWKNMLKQPLNLNKKEPVNTVTNENNDLDGEKTESIIESATPNYTISLYFSDSEGKILVAEKRDIVKVEGIGRKTINELIKGPVNTANKPVFPEGTQLRDINIKENGLCIVDFSKEIKNIKSAQEEKTLISSVLKTLSQFDSIKEVTFMVEGEKVRTLGGFIDLKDSVQIGEM